MTTNETLKKKVHDFWNEHPCGNDTALAEKYSKDYYEQIENFRYKNEPVILTFADFSRYRGKKILEVGVGMGTDFVQWVRAGAVTYGLDLTEASLEHVRRRMNLNALPPADLRVGDVEHLPYSNDMFDLVYSWGVIMHTPDTQKALSEIVRVVRPGGEVKLMVYNRYSLNAFYVWLKNALLKGRPWKSFSWALYRYQESYGTKAFAKREIIKMIQNYPVEKMEIRPHRTYADNLSHSQKPYVRWFGKVISILLPFEGLGWFYTVKFIKK